MDPWETPALTGYSYEHFPSRNISSHLLLRKEKIRRRSAVDWEDIKPYWKSEKRSHLSLHDQQNLLFTSFSKTLQTTERGLTGW